LIPLASSVLSAGLLGWVAALILFLTKGARSRYIRLHVVQAMIFQILFAIFSSLLMFVANGLWPLNWILAAPLWAAGILFPIMGAMRAKNGREMALPIAAQISRALID
jgi:uncharacterized membrane protein